jgi:hypothetical protein
MYLGATVQAASLVIWPLDTWPEDTSTRLYLRFLLRDSSIAHFVLDTDADGQTPRFTQDEFKPQYSYSQIGERLAAWKADDWYAYQDTLEFYEPEVFDLVGSAEYGGLIGSKLGSVEILCVKDYDYGFAGVILLFDNGMKIWSNPGTDGNTIWLEFDRRYLPDDCRFYKVRLDMDCRSEDDCKQDRPTSAGL